MSRELFTLCAGHVTHDRIGMDIVPGGCAFYAARTIQSLGAHSRLVSTVGEDFACDAAITGIECRLDRRGQTTVFENSYPDGAWRVQTVTALAPEVAPARMPPAWQRPDVLFIGPVDRRWAFFMAFEGCGKRDTSRIEHEIAGKKPRYVWFIHLQ